MGIESSCLCVPPVCDAEAVLGRLTLCRRQSSVLIGFATLSNPKVVGIVHNSF